MLCIAPVNVYDTHKLLGKKLLLAVQPLNVNKINFSEFEFVLTRGNK
jgi:hypothetical protein